MVFQHVPMIIGVICLLFVTIVDVRNYVKLPGIAVNLTRDQIHVIMFSVLLAGSLMEMFKVHLTRKLFGPTHEDPQQTWIFRYLQMAGVSVQILGTVLMMHYVCDTIPLTPNVKSMTIFGFAAAWAARIRILSAYDQQRRELEDAATHEHKE